MKRLLYITFIISSLNVFAQEKGPICSIFCTLTHTNGPNLSDHFSVYSLALNNKIVSGAFHPDPLDSTIFVITLPIGDSLVYHGGWTDWGPCISPDLEVENVDGVLTVLEGVLFPITAVKTISSNPDWDYSISQDAVIRDSCLLEIKAVYVSNPKSYFIRVNFGEAPALGVLENTTKEIYMILKDNGNTLFIEADENVVLNATIYSLSGQVIQKSSLQGSQEVDISNLPKGCYIARISSGIGLEKQLKFIK